MAMTADIDMPAADAAVGGEAAHRVYVHEGFSRAVMSTHEAACLLRMPDPRKTLQPTDPGSIHDA